MAEDTDATDGSAVDSRAGASSRKQGDGSSSDMGDDDDDDDMNNAFGALARDSTGEDDEKTESDTESDNEQASKSQTSEPDDPTDRAKLGRIMNEQQESVTASITQAAKADVAKGQAVKVQRKTFDALLNTRTHLQKALVSSNSLSAEPHASAPLDAGAAKAAEAAALTLLTTLTDLCACLEQARAGSKRKRPVPFTPSTPTLEVWAAIHERETAAVALRNSSLEKWSTKTKSAPTLAPSRHLADAGAQQTVTDVLRGQLSNSEHLIKRTRTPRSCAPLQAAQESVSTVGSLFVYDDADFYGQLLQEMLSHRSADVEFTANGADANGQAIQTPWQASREAKIKKAVDTRASKGRKLRYTVHEKLQNFMAPEDRGSWAKRQRDELFASLFGGRAARAAGGDMGQNSASDNEDGANVLALFGQKELHESY